MICSFELDRVSLGVGDVIGAVVRGLLDARACKHTLQVTELTLTT